MARKCITLTAKWLGSQGACNDQEALALLYFGGRVTLTRTVLLEMAELGLSLDWLASRVLDPTSWDDYNRAASDAWIDYSRAKADAWAANYRAKQDIPRGDRYWRAKEVDDIARASVFAARSNYNRAKANALADALGLK